MHHINKTNSNAFYFLHATKLAGAKNPANTARGRQWHLDGRTSRNINRTIGWGALWQTCEVEIKSN